MPRLTLRTAVPAPRARAGGIGVVAGLCLLVLAGCHREPPPPFPVWSEPTTVYVPQPDSSNAFDHYVFAAMRAERDGEKHLRRTSFYPGQRQAALQAMQPALELLRKGASKEVCDFKYRPRRPYEPAPYHLGWRLLGRALAWTVSDASEAGNYDRAIAYTVLATRFGFDLTGGSALDAALGLGIIDDARRAIAPFLTAMDGDQLYRLARGIQGALERKPDLAFTIQNEKRAMLAAVQAVQDAYRSDDYTPLVRVVGSEAREAVNYLRGLRGRKDREERPKYFQGFAAEAEETTRTLLHLARLPAADRAKEPGARLAKVRPWRRFARHFFGAGRPLLELHDSTLARTRLLILEAQCLRTRKKQGVAPKSLDGFTKSLTLDPYTGLQFPYRALGQQFELYSVGANLLDDGGNTDESYTQPDLRLERPQTG